MTPETRQILTNTYPWLGNLQSIANGIVSTLFKKEQHYAGSWQKRGGPGAFMMLARKWDRIENLAKTKNYDIFEAVEKNDGDVVDDIDDLIGYLLLVRSRCSQFKVSTDDSVFTLVEESTTQIIKGTIEHPAPFGYAGEDEPLPAPPGHSPGKPPAHRPLKGDV